MTFFEDLKTIDEAELDRLEDIAKRIHEIRLPQFFRDIQRVVWYYILIESDYDQSIELAGLYRALSKCIEISEKLYR